MTSNKNSIYKKYMITGLVFGLFIQISFIIIDALYTYEEISLYVIEIQQGLPVHWFMNLVPLINVLLGFILAKKSISLANETEEFNDLKKQNKKLNIIIENKNKTELEILEKLEDNKAKHYAYKKILKSSLKRINSDESIDLINLKYFLENDKLNNHIDEELDYLKLLKAESEKALNKNDNIKIIIKSDEQFPKLIFSKKELLEKLFNCLIYNSLTNTQKGKIIINNKLEKTGSIYNLRVEIIDNGKGIDNNETSWYLNKIFKKDKDYNGIQLPLAKKISDQLKGKISLESKLGKSTSYYIEIPIKKVSNEKQDLTVIEVSKVNEPEHKINNKKENIKIKVETDKNKIINNINNKINKSKGKNKKVKKINDINVETKKLIDSEVINDLKEIDSDNELLIELIEKLKSEAPKSLDKIHKSAEEKDLKGLVNCLENVISFSLNLGLIRLKEYCKEIIETLEENPNDISNFNIEKIKEIYNESIKNLDKYKV